MDKFELLKKKLERERKAREALEKIVEDRTREVYRSKKLIEDEKALTEKYLDIANVMILVLNMDGTVRMINRKGRHVLGFKEDEIVGMNLFEELIPDRVKEEYIEIFKALLAGNIDSNEYTENLLLTKNGEEKTIGWHHNVLWDEEGNITGTISSGEDLTEFMEIQKKLVESEERNRIIIDNANTGISITDENETLSFVNPAFASLLGYSVEEMKGFELSEIVTEDSLEEIKKQTSGRMKGKTSTYECTLRHKSGESKFVIIYASPMKSDAGEFIGTIAVVTDITEQRKAENALRLEKKYFEELFEGSPEAVIMSDNEGNVLRVNKAFTKLFGYENDDVFSRSIDNLIADESTKGEAGEATRAVASGETISIEGIRRHKDGTEIDVSILGHPIYLDNEQIGVYAIYRDITKRKNAERALKKSHSEIKQRSKEVRALLDCARIVLEGKDFSSTAKSILDYCKNTIGARSGNVALLCAENEENEVIFVESGGWPCHSDPELPIPIKGLKVKAYKSGMTIHENDFMKSGWKESMPDRNVELRNVLFAPLVIDHKVVGTIGLANKDGKFNKNDVRLATTFGEIAAIALRNNRYKETIEENEERFRELFNSMGDGVAIYEFDSMYKRFIIKDINKSGEQISRVNRQEIIGKSLVDVFPGSKEIGLYDSLLQVFDTGIPKLLPASLYEDKKLKQWVENYIYKLPSGEIVAVYSDITEKVEQQERINEHLNFLKSLIDTIKSPIFFKDEKLRYKLWNKAFEEYIGLDYDQLMNKTVFEIAPEDLAQNYHEKDLAIMEDKGNQVYEGQLKFANGSIRDVVFNKAVYYDFKGNPAGIVGVILDISDLRNMEMEIKESENKFRTITENINIGIYRSTFKTGEFIEVNPALVRMLGYDSREELLNIPLQKIIAEPGDRSGFYEKMIESTVVRGSEIDFKRKDGSIITCYESSVVVKDKDGVPIFFDGILEDVTERKKAEDTIRQSEEKFRSLFESSNDAVMILNETGFIDCNDTTLHIFGLESKQEFLSMHPADFSPEKQADGSVSLELANKLIGAAYETGVQSFTWNHQRKNGEVFPAEVLLNRVILSGGTIIYAVVRDISEKKKLEAQKLYSEQLETINKMVVTLNHEMNQPLSIIISQADMALQDTVVKSQLHEDLTMIKEEAWKISEMIKKIRQIKEIKLTEYSEGIDMIDLKSIIE